MAKEVVRPNIAATLPTDREGKGLVFYLIVVYLIFDLVRPSFVWHFPKIIAVILVIAWISKPQKVVCPQILYFGLFVAILAIDIAIAENTYDAIWTTYGMLMLLIGICVPLINFTDTLAKLRRSVNALLGIFLYIAAYAIFHAGFGPAGSAGGQDENYVAAAMSLAIPLAWFSVLSEKSRWKKLCFAGLVCVYILAIVVGLSRGGLVGMLFGLGYAVAKSPKRGWAIAGIVAVAGFLSIAAGTGLVKCNKYDTDTTQARSAECPSYWEHMSTMTHTSEGTADLRLEFWQIAIREFLAYPLTGVGGENFKWRMAEFQSVEQLEKFGRFLAAEVHSTYFQLLADMGLAGCIIFSLVLVRTYRDYRHIETLSHKAIDRLVEPRDSAAKEELIWIQNYGRGLMAGSIGYLASVAFLSALYYSHIWIAVSLMAALHVITVRRIGEDGGSKALGKGLNKS
jgi:hypothetical protein